MQGSRIKQWCVTGAMTLLLSGCHDGRSGPGLGGADKAMTVETRALKPIDPEALRGDLRTAMDRWFTRMMGLTTQITAQTSDREVREACLRLKIRTATAIRFLAAQQDPRSMYLGSWLMAVQFRQLHTEGVARDEFGEHQPLIVGIAREGEEALWAIGRKYFTHEQLDAAKPEIEEIARRLPMSERFVADRVALTAEELSSGRNTMMSRLIAAPLSPISGLQGVADTPTAINNVSMSVFEFGRIMRDMPELARWHLELLLYEANDLPFVVDVRRDFDRLAGAFVQLADKVDTLPDDLRSELAALLKESDASQEKLQLTIIESRKTIDSLSLAIDKATVLSQNVSAATEQISQLMGDRSAEPAKGDADDPITLADINTMLNRATSLTLELRALLAEAGEPLPRDSGLIQTLDASIDRLTWRGLILIAAALGAALTYHFITRRTRGSNTPGT